VGEIRAVERQIQTGVADLERAMRHTLDQLEQPIKPDSVRLPRWLRIGRKDFTHGRMEQTGR